MEKATFKTNIKCLGCVESARPFLNEAAGDNHWEVDIDDPDKLLTVTANGNIDKAVIISALKEAGYTAEPVSQAEANR